MGSKKVLFVATVVKKHINVFHLPYLQWFQEQGYETHVCARDDFNGEKCVIPYCDKHFDIPFERSPLNKNNIKAYRQLKKIINENNYDIIHCHTPVAAMLTRLAARKARKKGTKVIYTAHGFHFFKGASIINWLVYFPIEWICSFMTDVLITINQEDFNLSRNLMKSCDVKYVPGVGVDINKFSKKDINFIKRRELGIPEDSILLLSVGELSKRKNHEIIIKALSILRNPNVYYIICGEGDLRYYLTNLCETLGLKDRIIFTGFCHDVDELYKEADVFCFPSKQEGLPVSLMEAMASGLPVICSDVRGNRDLVQHGQGGYVSKHNSIDSFVNNINQIINNKKIREEFCNHNLKEIRKYELDEVRKQMVHIYRGSI